MFGSAQRFLICARATGGEIEQSQNGRAPGAFVSRGPSEDVVRGDATLAIRRTGQRNERPWPRDAVTHFNGIATAQIFGSLGLQMFVHADAAECAEFETGIPLPAPFPDARRVRERRCRPRCVGRSSAPRPRRELVAGFGRLKRSDRIAQMQGHSIGLQLARAATPPFRDRAASSLAAASTTVTSNPRRLSCSAISKPM